MVESLPFLLILSTVLGFLAGIGVGGGSLLMLWLTIVLELPQTAARGINLLFFIPSALIACLFRWKQGVLEIRCILPAILAGCISALLFSWIGTGMDISLLKKLFGGLLIITGFREIFYKQKRTSK